MTQKKGVEVRVEDIKVGDSFSSGSTHYEFTRVGTRVGFKTMVNGAIDPYGSDYPDYGTTEIILQYFKTGQWIFYPKGPRGDYPIF